MAQLFKFIVRWINEPTYGKIQIINDSNVKNMQQVEK